MRINIQGIDKIAILQVLYAYAVVDELIVKRFRGQLTDAEINHIGDNYPSRSQIKIFFEPRCCGLWQPNLNFTTVNIEGIGQKRLSIDLSSDELDISVYCSAQGRDANIVAKHINQIAHGDTNILLSKIKAELLNEKRLLHLFRQGAGEYNTEIARQVPDRQVLREPYELRRRNR